MGFAKTRVIQISANLGKAFATFILGSLVVHVLVMSLDYYVMIKPLDLNLHDNFFGSIFSKPMLPMMLAYGFLSLTIYFLWEKRKKSLLLVREKEIQNEKVEAVFKFMQRITGILAGHIANHNAEIMSWADLRKRQGLQVSEKVERLSQGIADALHTLSELSFIIPYTKNRPQDFREIEKMLKDKLNEITPLEQNEKYSLRLKEYKATRNELDSNFPN